MRFVVASCVFLSCLPADSSPGTERAFNAWVVARQAEFRAFKAFLKSEGVDDVVAPWTLLRQGTDHAVKGEPAFAMPPRAMWPKMVTTLRVLERDIIPLVGAVEVWSGFRTAKYNAVAGGAKGSTHLSFRGLDVVPKRKRSRRELHALLDTYWRSARAKKSKVGIGFYKNDTGRFHVDAGKRHRRW